MTALYKIRDLVLGPVNGKQYTERVVLILLAVLIFAIFPASMSAFRLGLVGKYLTYSFVAIGLVLCWGYGGILSLGQGVFFGLGGSSTPKPKTAPGVAP